MMSDFQVTVRERRHRDPSLNEALPAELVRCVPNQDTGDSGPSCTMSG